MRGHRPNQPLQQQPRRAHQRRQPKSQPTHVSGDVDALESQHAAAADVLEARCHKHSRGVLHRCVLNRASCQREMALGDGLCLAPPPFPGVATCELAPRSVLVTRRSAARRALRGATPVWRAPFMATGVLYMLSAVNIQFTKSTLVSVTRALNPTARHGRTPLGAGRSAGTRSEEPGENGGLSVWACVRMNKASPSRVRMRCTRSYRLSTPRTGVAKPGASPSRGASLKPITFRRGQCCWGCKRAFDVRQGTMWAEERVGYACMPGCRCAAAPC